MGLALDDESLHPISGDGWTVANLASHFIPLTGPYDSSDEAVLDYQVQLMKLSGIDGVIVDWYGNANVNDYWQHQCQYGQIVSGDQKSRPEIRYLLRRPDHPTSDR